MQHHAGRRRRGPRANCFEGCRQGEKITANARPFDNG